MKHCPTCHCDELPDAMSKPEPAKIKCETPGCQNDASFITMKKARCYEHRADLDAAPDN